MGILDRVFGYAAERDFVAMTAAARDEKRATIPFNQTGTTGITYVGDTDLYRRYTGDEWVDTSWGSLVSNIYTISSVTGACLLKLAQGFPEPPPMVKVNNEESPDHPLLALLNHPNPLMSHGELMVYSIIYRAVGGNCYIHMVRVNGKIAELWPYHQGQIWPVASSKGWIDYYEYNKGHGQKGRIDPKDIIHLKWPLPDLAAPYQAMSPLTLTLREVMTDLEATRTGHALLKNDLVPHGAITLPPGTPMSPQQADKLRDKFEQQHGRDKKGGVVILEQGAAYNRVSLNPQEMDLSGLRRVPEARVAANFGVPAIVAGLNVGLERSTYTNYPEAIRQMTQGTFVPFWRSDGVELTQALQREFPGDPVVAYNTSLVAALQEDTNEKHKRANDAYENQLALFDEARAWIDLPPIDTKIPGDQRGNLLKHEIVALGMNSSLQPRTIDAIVSTPPPQLTDEGEE